MSGWTEPLSAMRYRFEDDHPLKMFTQPGWIPDYAGSAMSENLPSFLISKSTSGSTCPFCKKGYCCRMDTSPGLELNGWSNASSATSNTSQYFQPCDQNINRELKREGILARDGMCTQAISDTKSVTFKLITAVAGYSAVPFMFIKRSWKDTGLCLTNFRFVQIARAFWRASSISQSPVMNISPGEESAIASTSAMTSVETTVT